MNAPLLFSGSDSEALAAGIATHLGVRPGRCSVRRFPDGELDVELHEPVRGREVYLVQSTHGPVGEHLLELQLLADAARCADAARITAVIPYFGYARHDRRERDGRPLGVRVTAQALSGAGIARIIALDLHSRALEACFPGVVEHVSAVELLCEAVRGGSGGGVVVSPDLGAFKLAERYGQLLGLPVAVVHKRRLSGADVTATGITGEVRGLAPILVDDLISTAGTIAAAAEAVLAAGCVPALQVVATHGLFVGPAPQRLEPLPIRRVVTTDSVPARPALAAPVQVETSAGLLAHAVRRLHGPFAPPGAP